MKWQILTTLYKPLPPMRAATPNFARIVAVFERDTASRAVRARESSGVSDRVSSNQKQLEIMISVKFAPHDRCWFILCVHRNHRQSLPRAI
jgi:hypothetical protein